MKPGIRTNIVVTICLLIVTTSFATVSGQQRAIPRLQKHGTATQLVVDEKPFLILGGELGNSSSSSIEFMRPIWPKLAAMHLNTVLVPFYWELLEPTEGKFDFTIIDGLIADAKKNNLHIVPLWFGSWKNSMSCYVPAWVKTDQRRFPRSQDKAGNGIEILSPFSRENVETDARAFAALMRHLREFDTDRTVIMVQVENEIGMIPDSRDRSQIANELFNQSVPADLMNFLQQHKEQIVPELRAVWSANGFKTTGTWEEVFGAGPGTEELFMAWHFARYVNRVTEAGKAEYPLPMYLNAALIRPGYQPGQYPSAGPLPHLLDIWRAGAPKIDFLAPDIYFQNFAEWASRYHRSGNPVFIPEAMPGAVDALNAIFSFGQLDSIGFSPFSIDSLNEETANAVTQSFDMLTQISPIILEHQGDGTMVGLLPEGPEQRQPKQFNLGGYTIHASYERQTNQTGSATSGALVIATARDEFLMAGSGVTFTFEPNSSGDPVVGILSVDEGTFRGGQWIPGRRLNGDQTNQGRNLQLPAGRFGIQRIKLYRYR